MAILLMKIYHSIVYFSIDLFREIMFISKYNVNNVFSILIEKYFCCRFALVDLVTLPIISQAGLELPVHLCQ